ncbi:MAG: hypothetical protein EPO55_07430 [Reyranella sp.]|uniref:hypothetical protein n=1 Tax=Reyranella sp. TaxID=1929291 RepID=UPI0012265083|nr:hypothetical protein [Reyranella sp.]TAJ40922.1 MAG: hypothetical protein EPO55_07430 [Reyranella sp.]
MATDETPHSVALKKLLEKAKDTISVEELNERLDGLVNGDRTQAEIDDYRLHRGTVKKLTDEIFPVSRLLRYRRIKNGLVSFPLDSHVPDAWLTRKGSKVGIEVTISQGVARNVLGNKLVKAKGAVGGYSGLQDDAKKKAIKAAAKSERAMYSTKEAQASVEKGILACLKKKNAKKYAGMTLLIEAPLGSLPFKRWKPLVPRLKKAAKDMPFSQIYVVSKSDKVMGMRIK